MIEAADWTIISTIDQRLSNRSWEEADPLIRALHARGVAYLIGDETSTNSEDTDERELLSAAELVQSLARCSSYPGVRDASISLFLLHPELAPDILHALQKSEPEVR